MTPLTKRVERLVTVPGFGPLVVAIDRAGVTIRRPRTRRVDAWLVPWGRVYDVGGRLRAAELLRERATRRAEKRAARGLA